MSEFSRNWAVVIGINNYGSGIPPLQNAVNDAKKLVEILREKHGYKVWVFLDQIANLKNLNHLLEKTLPQQVTTDDRLLFYFAGHGTIDGEGDDGPVGYFLPQDARRGETTTYLPMTKLYESLNKLPCRHFLGILDCCFAGAFRWLTTRDLLTAPEKIYQERYERYIKDPAWQIITSAAYDQKALDIDPFAFERGQIGNNSPFAAALLEALQGAAKDDPFQEGVITATKLYSYLRDRIEPITHAKGQRQTPVLLPLRRHDKGEYIFLSPGHPLNLELSPPLNEKDNPYKGLFSFEEEDSKLFFGRKALTKQLYERVSQQPLTIVLGASGSGKSSLVKAGLIPYIKENYQHWDILAPIRPGESAFRALRNAFAKDNLPIAVVTTLTTEQKIESIFASLNTWFNLNPTSKLLIIIDQLEELITLSHDEQEREAFLNFLAKALEKYQQQLRIVFTLRIDFETQLRSSVLEAYWQVTGARFFVEDMTREELRQVIEEPASKAVIFFEPHNLVEDLIDEVYQMPGALPLLSFTLSELYLKYLRSVREQGRNNRAITQIDYQEIGGILGSITKRADEEYDNLVNKDKDYELIVSNVMLRMVAVGDGELARRRVPESELVYPEPENSRVRNVINQFVDARLLFKDEDEEGKSYVEPAHDALISRWEKILAWKKQKQEDVILQRRLTPAAQEWKTIESKGELSGFQAKVEPVIDLLDRRLYVAENFFNNINAQFPRILRRQQNQQGRSGENPVQYLWNANPYLDVLSEQLKSSNNWFNQVEAEFIQQSVLQKRRNTSWRWRIAIAVVLGLSGLTFAALIGLIAALRGQRAALIGQIGELRKTAEISLGQNQALDGMIHGLQAGNIFKHPLLVRFPPNPQLKEQVQGTLQEAIYTVRESNRLEAFKRPIRSVSFNPKRELLATSGDDGVVRVWNLQGQLLAELSSYQDSIRSVSFSPNGQQLAGGRDDGTVSVWNLQGQLLAEFKGHQDIIRSVSFSPDGRRIASAGDDGVVRLWNLQGQLLAELKGHQRPVRSAIFSPNGQIVASAGEDRTIRLWKQGKQLGKPFVGHQNTVTSISFSPNGQQLASASEDETVHLWNLQGQVLKEWKAEQRKIWDLAFSPDGQQLATAGGDGTVRFWNFQGKELERFVGHQGPVRSISFSPGGQRIASASDDLTVRLWDLQPQEFATSKQHQAPVTSISLSQDGRLIASAGNDGTYRWTLKGQQLIAAKVAQGPFSSVSLSQDGQQWASGGKDGSIHIWNLQGQQLAELRGHQGAVRSISFSRDGQKLVSAGDDDTIRLWNVQNKLSEYGNVRLPNFQKPLLDWKAQQQGVNSVSFSGDGKFIVSAGKNSVIRVWDLQGNRRKKFEGHLGPVNSSVFSPDSKQVVSGGNDGTIRVWNLQNEQNERLFQLYGPQVMSVAFSHDGKRIVSGADNGNVQLWDTKTEAQLPLAAWTTKQSSVNSISLSQDDKLLATAGKDGSVKLWQLESFDQLNQRACDRLHDYFQNNPKSARPDCLTEVVETKNR